MKFKNICYWQHILSIALISTFMLEIMKFKKNLLLATHSKYRVDLYFYVRNSEI